MNHKNLFIFLYVMMATLATCIAIGYNQYNKKFFRKELDKQQFKYESILREQEEKYGVLLKEQKQRYEKFLSEKQKSNLKEKKELKKSFTSLALYSLEKHGWECERDFVLNQDVINDDNMYNIDSFMFQYWADIRNIDELRAFLVNMKFIKLLK